MATPSEDRDLPASIRTAWGLGEPPRRGPRRGLSLEAIVGAAVRVAATEGLEAASMGRVARELGAGTMALYRYVGAKEELLALMVDAALGAPPAAAEGEDWRAGLARWARGHVTVLRRHPWSLRVPISGPPTTPNLVAWLEDGLAALHDTGLHPGERLSVILLLSGYVRNAATVEADLAAGLAAETEFMPSWARRLRSVAGRDRFPELYAALESGVMDHDDDPDDEFVFGLERILDGVAALVAERRGR